MRTTITLDDSIFADLMRFTEAKSRAEAIRCAVAEWVRRKRLERLKSLRGKLQLDGDLDEFRQLEIDEMEALDG